MKYKLYYNGSFCQIPGFEVDGFGELELIRENETIHLTLSSGEGVELVANFGTGEFDQELTLALDSGDAFSAFYVDSDIDRTMQTGYGSFYETDCLFVPGSHITIWRFDGASDLYDPEDVSVAASSERGCHKYGATLAGIIQCVEEDGDLYWRTVDPKNFKYKDSTIWLPKSKSTLYVSREYSVVAGGEIGVYYVFEDGSEGIGFYDYQGDDELVVESYEGWFGNIWPEPGDRIYIYHCGQGLYEYYSWSGLEDSDSQLQGDIYDMRDWCETELGRPTIIEYDGSKWILIEEGDRNDF